MSKALAKRKDTAGDMIKKMKPAIMKALPKHITGDRMARVLLTAMRKTPELLKCSEQSLMEAIMTASQLGLEPGVNGQCWILPFGKEATFVPGYQGLIELVYRSNLVDNINGNAVYEGDDFYYSLGTSPGIKHIPSEEEDRGALKYAYAVAYIKGSTMPVFKVLTKSDIEKVKKASKSASSKYSPWHNWPESMWIKTAIKRLIKMLPKSAEISKAVEADDHAEILDVEAVVMDEVEDDPLAAGTHKRKPKKPMGVTPAQRLTKFYESQDNPEVKEQVDAVIRSHGQEWETLETHPEAGERIINTLKDDYGHEI